jgi:hypothetical protein
MPISSDACVSQTREEEEGKSQRETVVPGRKAIQNTTKKPPKPKLVFFRVLRP